MKPFFLTALLTAAFILNAGELLNCDFAAGLENWTVVPSTGTVSVEEVAAYGKAAVITAAGKSVSLTSAPVEVSPGQLAGSWVVDLQLLNEEISVGSFGISAFSYNAAGKMIKQIQLLSVPATAARDWRPVRLRLNYTEKTRLPEDTAKIALRFSFWNRDGNPAGTVKIAALKFQYAESAPPPKAAAPKTAAPKASDRLLNGDFADGLTGWQPNPAGSSLKLEEDAAAGRILVLSTAGTNAGVDSTPVRYTGGAWQISFRHRGENTGDGSTAVAVKALDKNGKLLKQLQLVRVPTSDWKDYNIKIGPGTKLEIPADTATLVFRVTFWAPKGGKPAGTVKIGKITMVPATE